MAHRARIMPACPSAIPAVATCRRVDWLVAAVAVLTSMLMPISVGADGNAGADWQGQELSTRLGVGYAVLAQDMNDDQRPDIVIVDQKRLLWLENPHWAEHVFLEGETKPDNVCLAAHDIDGDGRLDFAVGADWTLNTQAGGTVQWIRSGTDGRWQLHPIGEEPTVHRIRFVDLTGDGRSELVVVPLLGRNSTRPHFSEQGVRILAYTIPADPRVDKWPVEILDQELHVTHNFFPCDLDQDGQTDLLVASFEGVSLLRRTETGRWERKLLAAGDQASSPNRGASEVKLGRRADGAPYLATIEPWHGNQVVVYTPPPVGNADALWSRRVIDDQLQWGHAVACADLDGDADDELVVGVRDDAGAHRCGVRIYDPGTGDRQRDWSRRLLDPGAIAVEDLAVADLDGDGRADIVAVGRHTHNVIIYWNRF